MEAHEMLTQVLFIQGAGQAVHDAWDDKLVRSLERALGGGYTVLYPRMPDEADPRYSPWKAVLVNELDKLNAGAILIGHSVGGTFLIHALAEHPAKRRPGAVSLIGAPFIGDGGWPSDEIERPADLAERLPPELPLFLYHGTADDVVPFEHLELYAKLLPQAVIRRLRDRNHQLDNDLSDVARDIRSLSPRSA
jgi:predicted alpha/beta hydrolase family esterase